MLESEFRTSDVPAAERFDFWCELVTRTTCPQDLSSAHASRFEGELRTLRVGTLRVWRGSCQPMSWLRTPRRIREADPEEYHLSLPLRGTLGISQNGRRSVHGPGEMYVISTSRPYECLNGSAQAVCVELPRALLPLRPAQMDRVVAHGLPGSEGPGGLLAELLVRLVGDAASYRAGDGPHLERVVVELLAATLARRLDADDTLPHEVRTRTLALSVHAFVQRHLGDPWLTPAAIAAAHHVSVSHLHRVFATLGHDTTLAAWIRARRLEGARRDLGDPARRDVPVYRVAARWGFPHPPVFSRSFRAAFGVPPTEYREAALGDGGDGGAGADGADGRGPSAGPFPA
ncbi:helix-turn-helix domain-containing protein [Streptomyces sp. 4N509B]|uniref:AraC-like ligand-binding domain-containing protein n=1 Tax=Streptomyces sp. 4N509B TaxID=3457413 RepID=UPI003FD30C3E